MKRKVTHKYSTRAVLLTKNDFEEIIAEFEKIEPIHGSSDALRYEISDENYTYGSLEDWRQSRDVRAKEIRISPAGIGKLNLSLNIRIKPDWISPRSPILLRCDSEVTEVAYHRIRDILHSRRRFLPIGMTVLFVAALVILSLISATSFGFSRIAGYLFGVLMFGIMGVFSTYEGCPSAIDVEFEESNQTFWGRNKDKVILGAITAFVGGLIGYLIKSVLS